MKIKTTIYKTEVSNETFIKIVDDVRKFIKNLDPSVVEIQYFNNFTVLVEVTFKFETGAHCDVYEYIKDRILHYKDVLTTFDWEMFVPTS